MLKLIRIRVYGYGQEELTVVRSILSVVGGKVILDRVYSVQMEGAVDIDCVFIGGWFKRIVTFTKFMCRLAKLRNDKINVEILWGV